MVDNLRSGGFGSPFLGYGTRQGGFSQYRIGSDSGESIAYLRKYEAQLAWQNGIISDDAYIAALEKYLKSTDKGTTQRASAENQLADAVYNIGRNRLVVAVNRAVGAPAKQRALRALIAYDRGYMRGMTPDNEQYRQIADGIRQLNEQVRSTRWGAMVDRYNADKVSDARMRAFARELAREAKGAGDEQAYRALVKDFGDRILDQRISKALSTWRDAPSAGRASIVESLYRERMGGMAEGSPRYAQYQEALDTFRDQVKSWTRERDYAIASSRHDAGYMSDYEWLDFLRERVGQEKRGSVEYIRARDSFIAESFNLAETNLRNAVADGSRDVTDLIDFYSASMASMDLDSTRAKQLRAEIANLRAAGLEAIQITQPEGLGGAAVTPGLGGHYVYPGGAPPDLDGFISQHDGSAFARTNCGMAATAMLAWDVTDGRIRATGGEMRYYSGDREGGTWTDDMVRAMAAVGVGARAFSGLSLSTFRKRIAGGKPAVLTGTNANLPPSMRFGYDGDHSVYVAMAQQNAQGQWFYWVMDPNGSGNGYQGAWWPETAIYAFGWQSSSIPAGSAVFAGKRGEASVQPGRQLPPYQRFDTDWRGKSTLGRGGGASRQEAGPRRDWSRGRQAWQRTQAAGGEAAVRDFLAAADALAERSETADGTLLTPAEVGLDGDLGRRRRAETLLARYDGDARLAMVEWFTGEEVSRDTTEWSKTARFYANAAARRLNLDPVPRADMVVSEVDPSAPKGPPPDPNAPAFEPDPEIAPLIDPELSAMSQQLLKELDVPVTADNVRTVAAWIRSESGGSVEGYNPLKLTTPGDEDIPGQVGRLKDGSANFGSLEEGIAATATTIRQDAPELVSALRSGDPEAFITAYSESDWSEQAEAGATAIIHNLNQLPGDTPIIARVGPRPFTAPTALSQAVKSTPDLADLLDVDPTDAVQLKWFQLNAESAKQAALAGDATWQYIPPGGTQADAIKVPFSAQMGRDILRVNLDYTTMGLPPTPDRAEKIVKAMEDYDSTLTEIDMEAARRFMDVAARERDRMLLAGEYTDAFNLHLTMLRHVNAVLGLEPNDTPDVAAARRELDDDDAATVTRWIEALEPRSDDPNDKEHYAPGGDPFTGLIRDGDMHVTWHMGSSMKARRTGVAAENSGYAQGITLKPDAMFLTLASDGTVEMHTRRNDAAMFEPVTEIDPITGTDVQVPAYRSIQSGLMRITSDGREFYQPVTTLDQPFVKVYDYSWSGRSRDILATQPDTGSSVLEPGPLSLAWLMEQKVPVLEIPSLEDVLGDQENEQPRAAKPDPEERILGLVGVHQPGVTGQPPIYRVDIPDAETGETTTWLSLDRMTWLGYVGDGLEQDPPGLVPAPGASFRVDPNDPQGPAQLYIDGRPYRQSDGPLSSWLGWYGLGDARQAGDERGVGSPMGTYFVRQTTVSVSPDGTVSPTMTDFTLSPLERWQAGQITYDAASARMEQQVPGWRGSVGSGVARVTAAIGNLVGAIPKEPRLNAAQQRQAILLALPGGASTASAVQMSASAAYRGATVLLAEEQEAARLRAAEQARLQAEQAARLAQPVAQPTPRPQAPVPTPKPVRQPQPQPQPQPGPSPRPEPGPAPEPESAPRPKPPTTLKGRMTGYTPEPTPEPKGTPRYL